MEPIKFYIGQESGIVVENKDFATSIFAEQYKQTFEIFNHIWQFQEKALANKQKRQDYSMFSNIIAFCGDRGEGKTSLLSSVKSILADEDVRKNAVEELHIEISPKCKSIKALELLDPLFFDQNHNLIELLLGQMIAEIIKIEQDRDIENYVLLDKRNDLLKKFESAKRRLKILSKNNKHEEYDELENLDDLAASVKLREELDSLFQDYAKYFKADKLIISLDDIDLNMTEGFQMVEQIRKYLSGLHSCILLIALKVDQMERLVMSSMREHLQPIITDEVIKEMARKYVVKLLPLGNRVQLPSGFDIAEKELVISDNGQETKPLVVKEFVVHLIFQKTRYIFVNGRSLCPIVPTNLRELRHLIGELWSLPDAKRENNSDNMENKAIFKHYFYYTWTNRLDDTNKKVAMDIISAIDEVALNKLVISSLSQHKHFSAILTQEGPKSLMSKVINPSNVVYNVSVGDVFYTIQRLSQKSTDINDMYLLFFIKACYSIKLYGLYNMISEKEENLYPNEPEEKFSIYKYDIQFQRLNALQRFLNGSYFTYAPGSLLSSEQQGDSRDRRGINGKNLKKYVLCLQKNYDKLNEKEREDYLKSLQMLEFFVLTTTHILFQKGNTLVYDFDRTNYNPIYLQDYGKLDNSFAFDVLSIFYNIVNIKATYQRINNILAGDRDFYSIAINNDKSLLNQMLDSCAKEKETADSSLPLREHGLISDAIIRFSEVQQSIIEMAQSNRNKHRKGENYKNISTLYDDIQKLKITIYPLDESAEAGYSLPFNFLSPIIKFIKDNASEIDFLLSNAKVLAKSIELDLSEEDRNKFAKYGKDLFEIFGPELKELSSRNTISKKTLINHLSNKYNALYFEFNSEYWNSLFEKKTFTRGELLSALLKDPEPIIKVYSTHKMLDEIVGK